MDRVLRVILIFGWILDCFPVSNICHPIGQLRFKWLSLSVFYTIFVAILGLLLQLDVISGFETNNISPNGTNSKAFRITMTSWQIIEVLHPLIVRIVGLFHCASVVKSIKGICEIQDLTSQFTSSKYAKLGRWRRRYNFWQAVAFLCLLLVTVGQIRSYVMFFFRMLLAATWKGQLGTYYEALLPPWKPLILVVSVCAIHNGSATVLMSLWLTLGFGLMLTKAHGEFSSCVHICLRNPTEFSDKEKDMTVLIFEHFKRLKRAFVVCGEVMGLYMLVTLGWILCCTVYSVFSLIWPLDGITGFVELAHVLLSLVFLVIMGHFIQNQVGF